MMIIGNQRQQLPLRGLRAIQECFGRTPDQDCAKTTQAVAVTSKGSHPRYGKAWCGLCNPMCRELNQLCRGTKESYVSEWTDTRGQWEFNPTPVWWPWPPLNVCCTTADELKSLWLASKLTSQTLTGSMPHHDRAPPTKQGQGSLPIYDNLLKIFWAPMHVIFCYIS